MNKILVIFFFLGILGVYVFANFLVFKDLIFIFKIERENLKIILGVFVLVSGLSFFVYSLAVKFIRLEFLHYYSSVWMGFITISFPFFLLIYLLKVLKFPYFDKLGIILLIFIIILIAFSIKNGLKQPHIKIVEIKYPHLPKALDGYKIAHLSDLHLGSIKAKNWSKKIVNTVNSLKPDIILITGDLIDRGASHIKESFYELKKLKAKDGVFAVTGNHEFYSSYQLFVKLLKNTGIKRLKNECFKVNPYLELIGMDDPELMAFLNEKIKLDEITKNCSKESFKIFLYHRPENFDKAINCGINLQLSGHTHRGQIFPINLIVSAVYRYSYGLFKNSGAYIYTTSGISTWGPPMRLFSENELPLIILRREN